MRIEVVALALFDLHCDTLYECYRKGYSLTVNPLHTDLTRGRHYAPWCQVFAVWIPDLLKGEEAFSFCLDALHFARAEAAANASEIAFVTDCDEMLKTAECGRCAALLAVENGAAIGGKTERIVQLAALGVRVMTLTWNGENEWGYGCGCASQKGLKPFGKEALLTLVKAGIVPDVSHLNEAGFWDVAEQISASFIASHSLSFSVCPHPRNLTDRQFTEIARRNGIVGLCFCKEHLGEQSLEAIRRHAEHFLALGGENTVALGGDLDGTFLPPEWQGMAVYEKLADHLAKKGWRDALIHRVFYQNAANFFVSTLHSQELPL